MHFVSAFGLLLALGATKVLVPDLWKDTVTGFATIGGFATFYGVVFAVIETWRGRRAAEQAQEAADATHKTVVGLVNVKGAAEAQTCIRHALTDLERDGFTSTSALARVMELYTAEFAAEYGDEGSAHRRRIAALQSHASVAARQQLTSAPLKRLKQTLGEMLTDLSAKSGQIITEKRS